jgi:hypothetical protein
MARPRPKPTFEGQLPPPERNPLALSVSALLHVVLILVVMLLSKKLAEQQAEKPKVDSAATREVAMVYVPPPKPKPVPPPPTPQQPVPTPPPEPPRPKVINKTPEPEPNAPPEAPRTQGTTEAEQQRAPDPVGDPTASAPDATPPAPVNKEDALNASMEMEAKRIFGKKKGGVNPDAGPVASRPLESLAIPNSKCPEIPLDSTGAPPDGVVKGRVVQQETGRPLSGAHLQMVGQTYHTFADDDGNFELHFDLTLMADCRVQYVTIIAPGYRSQMLPIVMGGGISTVPLKRR